VPISALILIAGAVHLAAFISYPHSGRFGQPFSFVSMLLWTGFSVFIARVTENYDRAGKAAFAALFALACAFSVLALLPQKDGRPALKKFLSGNYPVKADLYIGLLRLGVEVPSLAPPKKEETPL